MGGVEKKTPIDPMPMGAEQRDIEKSELSCSRQGLINASPMPRKKEPPAAGALSYWGAGHRTGMAPCPKGSIPQVKFKIEKNPPLTRCQKASEGNLRMGKVGVKPLPTKHFTIECRMVEQKKPPATGALSCWGSGHRTGKAPCPKGNLARVKLKVEEKRTPIDPMPMGASHERGMNE